MFLIFLSFAIFGIILLFSLISFYGNRNLISIKSKNKEISIKNLENNKGNNYIPILHPERELPGINRHEPIHFLGSCKLYRVEEQRDPQELIFDEKELTPELTGDVVLSSKKIVIYNGMNVKKIFLSSIEKYHFSNSFLIIKRKNVKKRKDILKLISKPTEFKYILQSLFD